MADKMRVDSICDRCVKSDRKNLTLAFCCCQECRYKTEEQHNGRSHKSIAICLIIMVTQQELEWEVKKQVEQQVQELVEHQMQEQVELQIGKERRN